ncbi:MAG: outer membrane protein assembly factor BamB [Pseudomonadota bacterium]
MNRQPLPRLGLTVAPALCLGAVMVLSGCSSAPRELVQPTPLEEIQNERPPVVVWSASAGSDQDSGLASIAPVEADGRLFVADPDGEVAAFDLDSGRQLWSADLDAPVTSGPGASENIVALGASDGRVFALDAETGETRWTASIRASVDAAPSVGFGDVAVRGRDGSFALLDEQTGEIRWRRTVEQPSLTLQGQGRMILFPDAVALGFDDGTFGVYAREDGSEIWSHTVALPTGRTDVDRMVDIDATPVFVDGVFYVVTWQGKLTALAARGGREIWSRDFSSVTDFAADDQALYLTDGDGVIWAIDRRSGDALWRQSDLAHRGLTGPALVGGHLVVGDNEGHVHVLTTTSGMLRGRVGWGDALVDPIRVVDGRGIAVSRDGELRVFRVD